MLTIAIPTYNRPKELQRCVEAILPQLTDGVSLEVWDDGGCQARQWDNSSKIIVWHNPVNLGADVNNLSIASHHKTGWLWILGDDDVIAPDGVMKALRITKHHQRCVYVGTCKTENWTTETTAEFFERAPWFGELARLSAGLWNMDVLHPYLSAGFHNVCSMMPMVAALWACMQEGDKPCAFTSEKILAFETLSNWSKQRFIERFPMLFDVLGEPARGVAELHVFEQIPHQVKLGVLFQGLSRRWTLKQFVRLLLEFRWRYLLRPKAAKGMAALVMVMLAPGLWRKRLLKNNPRYKELFR